MVCGTRASHALRSVVVVTGWTAALSLAVMPAPLASATNKKLERQAVRQGEISLDVRLKCLTMLDERIALMNALTVTAKGQITLKKEIMRHLGIHPGDKVAVEKLADGRIEIRPVKPTGKISDVFGMLKRKGQQPVSIEEMNEVIGKGWGGEL